MRACQPKDSKRREWRSVWGRERERERAHTHGREREKKCFGSSFYMFFPPPGPALCKLGLARSAVYSTWSLHSGPWTFLCSLFVGSSLPCLLATAILDSFSLFYLPNIPSLKRWEAQFFGNRGFEVFLSTSCWTGMARGIGPPPLASLKPQSPYSSVDLSVCDILCGRL